MLSLDPMQPLYWKRILNWERPGIEATIIMLSYKLRVVDHLAIWCHVTIYKRFLLLWHDYTWNHWLSHDYLESPLSHGLPGITHCHMDYLESLIVTWLPGITLSHDYLESPIVTWITWNHWLSHDYLESLIVTWLPGITHWHMDYLESLIVTWLPGITLSHDYLESPLSHDYLESLVAGTSINTWKLNCRHSWLI